jgi:hypothetical protein
VAGTVAALIKGDAAADSQQQQQLAAFPGLAEVSRLVRSFTFLNK